MIHHISIPANHPHHVAEVLAELLHGQAFPFPGHVGSYVAVALDKYGTMIEVYPLGTELTPGKGDDSQVEFQHKTDVTQFSALHAALSIPISQQQIEEIANKKGWRMLRCNRGPFEVIEFWIENRLLLELLTPELVSNYLRFMQPENLQQCFAGVSVA
jgi:hypothetical protein